MPETIKRLRNKIWLILVTCFYALILTSLLIIYLITSQNTQDVIYQTVYTRVLSHEMYATDTFFSVEVAVDDAIVAIHSDFNLEMTQYEELVRLVFENARDYNVLILYEQIWVYALIPAGETLFSLNGQAMTRIIFNDVTDIMAGQDFIFKTLVVFAAVSLILVLIAGYMLSNSFVKSTHKSFEQQVKITSRQKRFTANATHELRTPITLIKGGYEEIISNKDAVIESQMKWFEMIAFGISRMESLTSELLTLAKLENSFEPLEKTEVNVGQTVADIVKVMEILAVEKEIKITSSIDTSMVIHLNEEKFKQVLMIFVDNAIKYVNDAGTIEVTVEKKVEDLSIRIRNSGPGIPEKDLPKIFGRFYRLESTPKEKKGTGLGLPIAKEIIGLLGGTVTIDSVVDEFTEVEIIFSFKG